MWSSMTLRSSSQWTWARSLILPAGSSPLTGAAPPVPVFMQMLTSLRMRRYALAATILEQMEYKELMRHKASIIEVATTASVEQRNPMLGVIYDELLRSASRVVSAPCDCCTDCRKDWEERQAKITSFKPGDTAGLLG